MTEKIDNRILILIIVVAALAIAVGYGLITHQTPEKTTVSNNTTANNTTVNNTTVKNATLESSSESSSAESGQYGYCAICGKALSYSEANNEYTQGKVCSDCASNPYYQSGEGADYANQKLYEAYPDEYAWMNDDSADDDSGNDDNGDDDKQND